MNTHAKPNVSHPTPPQHATWENSSTSSTSTVNIKMLGLFGPSKHSTLNYLDPWMIKDIFSYSKMK